MSKASVNKHETPVVVGLGELLWDQTPDGRRWGGAPANFAGHAGQLGAEAWVVSAVGEDRAGEDLIQAVRAHGANTCVTRVAKHPTGRVDVRLDDCGNPSFHIAADSAWDHLEWSDELARLAARADAACFGSLAQRQPTSNASIKRFLEAMPDSAVRILDINLRAPYDDQRVVSESLEYANVLKVNEEEWLQLANWLDLDEDFDIAGHSLCQRFGLRCIIQTLGERGSKMVSAADKWAAAAVTVKPVDTVGAGDAFTATCCIGILRGSEPVRMLSAASQVASFVCAQPGGAPTLPEDLIAAAQKIMNGDH